MKYAFTELIDMLKNIIFVIIVIGGALSICVIGVVSILLFTQNNIFLTICIALSTVISGWYWMLFSVDYLSNR